LSLLVLAAVSAARPQPAGHGDLIGLIGALAGVLGTVAATVAVGVSVFQVRRDRERERHQAEARARSAKLLIGAAYASALVEVRQLERTLRAIGMSPAPIANQAQFLRDNQQLAIIFQALLSIDATALPVGALRPVEDAQAAFTSLRNQIVDLAVGRIGDRAADHLEEKMQALKKAFEQMRGFVPFEMPE